MKKSHLLFWILVTFALLFAFFAIDPFTPEEISIIQKESD